MLLPDYKLVGPVRKYKDGHGNNSASYMQRYRLLSDSSPVAQRILETVLFYNRKVREMVRDEHGRKKEAYHDVPIDCYQRITDPDGAFKPRLMFASGFIRRVCRHLTAEGYKVCKRDVHPHPHPEIFIPKWDQLTDVEWRWGQRPSLERLFAVEYGQVELPTGHGKSFMIRAICQLLYRCRIAVVTPSTDVIKDLFDNLSMHIPHVGIHTSKMKRKGNRVTCYSAGSLNHCEQPVDLLIGGHQLRRMTTASGALTSAKRPAAARRYPPSSRCRPPCRNLRP
jgi:hypothetical protein